MLIRREWEFWSSEKRLASLPPSWAQSARENLHPLRDRLDLADGEAEVVSGLTLLPTPGHRPGQMALMLSSEGERLLCVSDNLVHSIHVECPDHGPVQDFDRELAAVSRRRVCRRAAEAGIPVFAGHFAFPGLGRIVGDGCLASSPVRAEEKGRYF